MTNIPENTGRTQGGQFAPGHSGNPKGPPRGYRHKATQAAMALLDGDAEALTRKTVDLALEGDVTALRLCLERLIPARREAPVDLGLPPLSKVSDLPGILARLLEAAASGEATPGEALKLAGVVSGYVKAVELTEIEERIRALERVTLKGAPPPWG